MEKEDVFFIGVMVFWFWLDLEIQKMKINSLVKQTKENVKSIQVMNETMDTYNRRKEAHTQRVNDWNSRMDTDIELID